MSVPLSDPISRTRPLTAAFVLSSLVVGLLVGWAAVAEVEVAVRAEGSVVSSGNNRRAQHLEGGVVMELPIREGDRVEAGQVIAVITPVVADAEIGERRARIESLEAAVARLRAEAGGEPPAWPAGEGRRRADVVERENLLYESNAALLRGRLISLEEGAARAEAEARSKRAQLEGLRRQEEAVARSLAMQSRALREGAGMAGRMAEVETQLAAVRASMAGLPESAMADEAAAREFRARAAAERAAARQEAAARLSQSWTELEALREVVRAAEDRRRRSEVRAPVAGLVQRMHVFAPGEVVPPNSTVAEVVPEGEGLVFELRVRPDQVRGLSPGMPVLVRVSAYDVSRYGSMDGAVTWVSPDAHRDDRTGASHFRVRVRTDTESVRGEPIRVGMQGEASIITGRRKVLGYFFSPIYAWAQVALSER